MKTPKSKSQHQSCFTPAIPQRNAIAFFVQQYKSSKSDSENDHLREFVGIAEFLMANNRAIDLDMVLRETRKLEIPTSEVTDWFNKFTDTMTSLGKLSPCDGVYDSKIWIVC